MIGDIVIGRQSQTKAVYDVRISDVLFRAYITSVFIDMLLPVEFQGIGSLSKYVFLAALLNAVLFKREILRLGFQGVWKIALVFWSIFMLRALFSLSETIDSAMAFRSMQLISQSMMVLVLARGMGRIHAEGPIRYLVYYGWNCFVVSMLLSSGFGSSEGVSSGVERIFAINDTVAGTATAMSLAVAIIAVQSVELVQSGHWLRSMTTLLAAIPISSVMVKTGERIGVISLVVGLIVFVLLSVRDARRFWYGFFVVAGGMVVVVYQLTTAPEIIDRYLDVISSGNLTGRELIFPAGLQMFQERPFWGWGPYINLAELSLRASWFPVLYLDAHNNFLWVATATGVIGLLSYTGILLNVLHSSLASKPSVRIMTVVCLAVAVATSLSYTTLFSPEFWTIVGLAGTGMTRRDGMSKAPTLPEIPLMRK